MENFPERLKYFLKTENLTASELADKLNVQKSSISHLLSGRNKPGFDFLSKFAKKFPKINLSWLLTGEGPYESPTLQVEQEKKASIFPGTIPKSSDGNLEFPDELIKIYSDGTFEILKKRKSS